MMNKVPNGWKLTTLGQIAQITSGGTPDRETSEYWNGDIPWVTTGEVNFCEISDTKEKITKIGLDNSSAKVFPSETILMAMYGQGKTRGQVAKLVIPAATNQACAAILLKESFDADFYYQYLCLQYNNIRLLGNSGTQKNLNGSIIKEIIVHYPPLPEQIKIAEILSTWDNAINTVQKLLANSQQQKKSLMQQLLTGKKRLLDKNGIRFSGEWMSIKVGDLITPHSEKSDRNNQYPVLTSSRQGMMFQKDYYNGRDVASEDTTGYNVVPFGYFTYRHMSDDLIFFFNINEICNKGIVSTLYPVFKAKEEKINSYLLRLMLNQGREFKKFSLEQKQGGSRTYMYLSKLQELKLNVPCLEEQQKIATILTTADQEIDNLRAQLNHLKQEKKALMQQLLTGKRRVTTSQI